MHITNNNVKCLPLYRQIQEKIVIYNYEINGGRYCGKIRKVYR